MDNSKLPSLLHFKVEKKEPLIIDKPNVEAVIHEIDEPEPEPEPVKKSTSEQMGLKVVRRPKIKPEKIFEEPQPKKSRKQIKYVDISSSEEEDVNKETGEENPNFVYEDKDISELKSNKNPEIKNYKPVEETAKEEEINNEEEPIISEVKSTPKKKGRKPMTAEHKEKLRISLALAREKKQLLISEKKKSGYKTTKDKKKEKENLMSVQKGKTEVYEQQQEEMKRLKDELEKEKQKSKLIEEKKQENIITKEDLQQSQLHTLATFEMMRKERKEEKKKQKQIEEYNESVKETIKKINTPSYMRKAGKYKDFMNF